MPEAAARIGGFQRIFCGKKPAGAWHPGPETATIEETSATSVIIMRRNIT
jgi:hypothetical protein